MLFWRPTVARSGVLSMTLFERRTASLRMSLEPLGRIFNTHARIQCLGQYQIIFRQSTQTVRPDFHQHFSEIGQVKIGMMRLGFGHGSHGIDGIEGRLKIFGRESTVYVAVQDAAAFRFLSNAPQW